VFEHLVFLLLVVFLALLITYHSYEFRGSINTVCLVIISGGIGALVEFLGVLSGGYYYGTLPIALVIFLTGFGWIANVLIAFHLTIVILNIEYNKPLRLFESLKISLAAGLIGVIYDLFTDPVATAIGLWSWRTKGFWFGVPLQNFIGWFFLISISIFCYHIALSLSSKPLMKILYSIILAIIGSVAVFFGLLIASILI